MNQRSEQPVRLAVIGAGSRGSNAYAPYALAHPDSLRITAVAEPDEYRRERFASRYGLSRDVCFRSWEELLDRSEAEAVLIATQDNEHYAPLNRAMEEKRHILVEKPVSNIPDEIRQVRRKVLDYDRVFMICHVLRHTSFFRQIHRALADGAIGNLLSVRHSENVGYFHYAHSYVRGNWRREDESSPMILAKSCHDMDILNWLVGADCRSLASFGTLSHFHASNAPENAPKRCSDGCPAEKSCPYTTSHYFDDDGRYAMSIFAGIVKTRAHSDDLEEALRRSPYGRCVYRCDNDVVDHQVVSIEYENECTVSFTMAAFSNRSTRTITLMGTHGEIHGCTEDNRLEITDFKSGQTKSVSLDGGPGLHNGGDFGLIREFIAQVRTPDFEELRSANLQGLNAHIMAFAAESARRKGRVEAGFIE